MDKKLVVGESIVGDGWQGLWNEANVLIASFRYTQGKLEVKGHLSVNEVVVKS